MGAPAGNQFWKQRSKHGRDKIFESPDIMLEECQKFFNWCDAHPYYKNEVMKGGEMAGTIVKVPMEQPYTLHGLCIFLGVNSVYFNQFEGITKKKLSELGEDKVTDEVRLLKEFSKVITHVREVIYAQKFRGAAVGAFNYNIIARDLGLRDNVSTELKNPEGETFKTTSVHEVVFKKMGETKKEE